MTTWSTARNILCIRLDYLGDVLMTTPALHAIKQSLPGCRITLLTSPGGAAVAPFLHDVDATLAYAAPWVKHGGSDAPGQDFEMIERLRKMHFDAAIIFTVFSQNPLPAAMLCHLAGIPLRLAHCHENPYRLLTDWIPDPEPEQRIRHEVQRQLDLVASVGCRAQDTRMRFAVRMDDASAVSRLLPLRGISPDRPWLVMHPGATASSRRYPPHLWAQAIESLVERLDCTVILTGSQGESSLIDAIIGQAAQAKPHLISLAGELTLGQLGALIAQAPVLVSNNTGPAHIAAAVGTPVVDLYALTNPQHTPWGVDSRVLYHDVPCRFCFKSTCPHGHHECLAKVPPKRVADAALELMNRPPAAPLLMRRLARSAIPAAPPPS